MADEYRGAVPLRDDPNQGLLQVDQSGRAAYLAAPQQQELKASLLSKDPDAEYRQRLVEAARSVKGTPQRQGPPKWLQDYMAQESLTDQANQLQQQAAQPAAVAPQAAEEPDFSWMKR